MTLSSESLFRKKQPPKLSIPLLCFFFFTLAGMQPALGGSLHVCGADVTLENDACLMHWLRYEKTHPEGYNEHLRWKRTHCPVVHGSVHLGWCRRSSTACEDFDGLEVPIEDLSLDQANCLSQRISWVGRPTREECWENNEKALNTGEISSDAFQWLSHTHQCFVVEGCEAKVVKPLFDRCFSGLGC